VDDAVLFSTERVGLAETRAQKRCRRSRRAKRLGGGTHAAPGVSHSQEGHDFVQTIIAEHQNSSRCARWLCAPSLATPQRL